ncbi:uncharacterized protein MYCGRDRAFT_77812 [Zymoseptoria tritici IPO323]|uniref:Pyridoxamine 5'-phosphate oxidase N-terminal domain-containing protein n=1 Tax=Zymoseptoria tritici (strain CBS 115943 / IPO323) TaxID=336722 RepID=F9XQ11_ZYMTI|nr:uncharacterized protein MYCGRDRAFT_77812 [Zymoseptoria tritici IPO323]EGP82561.1 hypothetical protein MYCGRDRAFT_77812 [Zymoseptoria tritici IPO323]
MPSSSTTDQLPTEVVTCLRNARFLHLATCTNNTPHVSLMHYTFLPSNSFPSTSSTLPSGPTIIMTTDPHSKKTTNLLANPSVSLLVHDWVSTRPPSTTSANASDRERSPASGHRSSLAAMLMQMNSTAVSSISATINGAARVLEQGTEEERWCKEQHLANNTFSSDGSEQGSFGTSPEERTGDSGRGSYIADQDVRVVVVEIKGGRISDWKGGVKEWSVAGSGGRDGQEERNGDIRTLVNGVA